MSLRMREDSGPVQSPVVSVVIPTRDRAATLKFCLDTIVSQSYGNLQIVVSDNNSADDTEAVVRRFADSRITYVRANKSLSMNDSYNFALEAARGDFVTYIGDDDGFLPGGIEFGMQLLNDGAYGALTWRKLNYTWPDHRVPTMRNLLVGESEPLLVPVDGMRKLGLFAAFREIYSNLPCIYNSIVDMRVIAKARAAAPDGLLFGGIIPDVHSGIALSPFVGRYLQAMFPLTVNGASSMSSGVLQGLKERTRNEEDLISDISPGALQRGYDPDIGASPSVVSIAFGEFLLARSRNRVVGWPTPYWRRYVKALVREARVSEHQQAILASARFTAKRRRLGVRIPPATQAPPAGPAATSFQGRIVLPTDVVADVCQASKLVGSLLPRSPRIERHITSYFLRKWARVNFRMAIDFYRAVRTRVP